MYNCPGPFQYPAYTAVAEGAVHDDVYAPPRIPSTGLVSKVVIGGVAVCCCVIGSVIFVFVLTLVAQIPHVPITTPMISIDQRVLADDAPPSPPIANVRQRSVLRRLAMLKRAHPPAHGVDKDSVRMVFPDWLTQDSWNTDVLIPELLLALSYMVQQPAVHRSDGTLPGAS